MQSVRSAERQLPVAIGGVGNMHTQSLCGQYVTDDFTPLYYGDNVRVANNFGQRVSHQAGFGQSVKIEVVNVEFGCSVIFADRKGRASHNVLTACAAGQATRKRRLAAA